MERIINRLSTYPEINDWKLVSNESTGYQFYVYGKSIENLRKVVTKNYYLTIYCDQGNNRGATEIALGEHEIPNFDKRMEQGIFIARRIENPYFELPGPTAYPFVESYDPLLKKDIEQILFVRLADTLMELVEKEPNIFLSNSEFFLNLVDVRLQNSKGIDISYKKSKIFYNGVLLASEGDRKVDVHFESIARRLQDLSITKTVQRSVQKARDSLSATLPTTGRYPVVLTGEALRDIFSPLMYHTSARNLYGKTSRFQEHESIYAKGKPTGDSLTLISNGFIPFGLRTTPCDSDGVPIQRFEIIRDGVFENAWSSQRLAYYLNRKPTGLFSNLEIPIGAHPMDELLTDSEPVLQVVEVLGLLPDVVSGSFAAEIKLGYLHQNGDVRPVRGGAFSGNILTGFDHAFFSNEAQFSFYSFGSEEYGSYVGPKSIRFENFQVVGK